jgi:hypothetical protein
MQEVAAVAQGIVVEVDEGVGEVECVLRQPQPTDIKGFPED